MIVDSIAPLLIGACANLKPSGELCCYWNSGAILKIGPVTVRISRDNATVDVIGRCKITDGSKQALIMTWVVLAKYFYVNETLLMNYKGISPEVWTKVLAHLPMIILWVEVFRFTAKWREKKFAENAKTKKKQRVKFPIRENQCDCWGFAFYQEKCFFICLQKTLMALGSSNRG